MSQINSSSVYKPQKRYISSFHLIIWLFAVSIQLDDDDRKRIYQMYGYKEQHMIKVVIKKRKHFQETIKQIKKSNKDCVVKILLDEEMYPHLKDLCQEEEKISDIFLWKTTERFDQDILSRTPKLKPIKVMLTLEEALSRAEQQVDKWTKPYKTFKNYNQLTDLDNLQKIAKINRFRYTLISFINMRISDFQEAFKGFKDLVESEVYGLENHLSKMKNIDKSGRYLAGIETRLSNYQAAAEKFHEALQHQDSQSQKRYFYNYVMKFYQEQCFFYHIFNSNLKMIGGEGSKDKNELKYKRKELMLPFNHVYNSIKWLFRKEIQEKNNFYLQPFPTYRVYRSKVSQLNSLKEKLSKMQQNKESLFIEFYAPLSTTLSAKIAIDKFAFFPQEETEKQVFIRISVDSIEKYPTFLEQNCNIFLHGFFKMSKQQDKKGLIEQQILFNALNIFKVTRIQQMKVQDLFSQKERQILKRQSNKEDKNIVRQGKYQQALIYNSLYQSIVTVIDLEFGPFYDVLLEQNSSNLGKQEQKVKQNYLTCINKIGKYKNKFDYTDACVILKDFDECYQILKEKIQENDFAVSVKDGKNYFQQLAKVCRLLGRVTEALKYTNLAIECHKQLEQVHLCDVYNTHYDKLYDMQLEAISFYREYSELAIADKMLKVMLQQMQSQKFQNAKTKVRQSQVIMNLGINYYSKGKLDKSVKKFEQCKHRLSELIKQCQEQPIPSCYFCSYLLNLLCGGRTRQRSYQRYGERLRQELIQQRFRRYGSREEINESRGKANTLFYLTKAALKNQKLFFQNQLKYENLIRSNSFDIPQKKERSNHTGQELQKKIKDCIAEIAKIDDQLSPQYKKHMQQLLDLKKELEKIEINFFFEGRVETHILEYIKKFLQKEPQRRMKEFNRKRQIVKQAQKQKLIQKYTQCAQSIKRNILQLQKEGFVQSTNDMVKERNNLAKVLEKSQQRQEALKEIKKILDSKVAQKDSRFLEYATAYYTKGRIQLDKNQIDEAIKSFDNSLKQYQNFWRMTKEKQMEIGQQKDQDPNFIQSDHNNEFQMVKIIRIKANLKQAQAEIQVQKKHNILNEVQSQILQIMEIIKTRNPLKDSGQLISSLNEVHIHYKLNRTPYQNHKEDIFYLLKEMENLNITHEDSLKTILVLCQLISSFHTVQTFLLDLQRTDYLSMLKKAKFQCKDADVDIQWRISKAFYFIYVSNKQNDQALWCLRQAINILERLVKENKNKKHLDGELQYLIKLGAEKLSEVQTTLSTRPLRSHQIIIPTNQQAPSTGQFIPKPK